MPRTKGAKDRKPRKMNPASVEALRGTVPGYISASLRIYGPAADVRWFAGHPSVDRGLIVSAARRTTE